ncbi:MAG: hypothetical protein NW237_15785 [Cyanobacteriota bacterium]|nr:hypothetical protein [Cyanobacteriota bacterium]
MTHDPSQDISALRQAMQSRQIPQVAKVINHLAESERSHVVTPVLQELALTDPATAQWFIRHVMTEATRQQLKQGIQAAAIDYMQEAGFLEGEAFWWQGETLVLSQASLPYAAADDDPLGQLLVAEFCQLSD